MTTDERFTKAFVAYLAGNKGPEGEPAEYGISATGDESTGAIELTLVFKSGVRYCCSEWGCHIGVPRAGRWDELRRCLSASGLEFPPKITLHLRVVVEQGAVIVCVPSVVSDRQEYEETLREGVQTGCRMPERPPGYTGTWILYWENGQKYDERSYLNGELHGKSTQWNDRGQKLMECTYKDGRRHGTLTRWNCEGKVLDVSQWVNGTGTYRIHYSSGVLCSEQQLRHGTPHGVKRQWNGKGELTCTEYYEDGELIRREGTPTWHHHCAFQHWPADTQRPPT